MEKREVTLEDGRFLIFYTFDDEPTMPANDDAAAGRPEPQAEPEAEDEQSV
jgi:hypothetical protein